MNARSCERIIGLKRILEGHVTMVGAVAGDQWNEGDVSCSVVRRVVLPDAFFAADGLLQTTIEVLTDLGAYPAVVARELDRYLPFLATTKLLVAAVKQGIGRETAHEHMRRHAVAAALAMREQGADHNDLLDRVAADVDLPLARDVIDRLMAEPLGFVGRAPAQVAEFVARVEKIVVAHPEAAAYVPAAVI
jgi:adenylosuccinate lyase